MNNGQFRAGTSAGSAGTGLDAGAVARVEFDALGYLQSVYNDPMEPTGVRMRAAAIAIEYERASLKATALVVDGDFATRLEAAIERSGIGQKLIEAKPVELPPTGPDPTPMNAAFPRRRA
jgi:hypothetical protein